MATQPDGYIQTLQTKFIGFLNDHIELLRMADTILYRTFTFSDAIPVTQNIDQNESIDEIQCKIHDVQVLQIRMPIVASMKAGKSTIINALIGSEFLPTRSEAMTALPTAVVLKLGESRTDGISPAQLLLEDGTLKAIENLQSSAIKILKENFHDNNVLDALFHSNPHLIQTAKALRDDQEPKLNLQNKLEDRKQVQSMLTFINELVRISVYLSSHQSSSSLSLDAFLKNIPAIHVNYQPASETQKNFKQQCQLVLIDTPGPNEAAGVAHLPLFVKNELQKADVILTVVEYGHLNTEADAKIIDSIKKIHDLKQNQKCVYVLINKADLHRRKDISKAELRQHVAAIYNVPVDFVFQLSGSHALVAQKFLADYQKPGNTIDVKNSNTAKDVLEAYFPIDWEDHLDECEASDVEKHAKSLYKKSGVSDVLDSVLKTVASQVVKRCIQSAIEVCTRISKSLMTDVDIRSHGLKLIEDRLHKEIEDLNQDLADLAEIEKGQLVTMKEISATLENELKTIFQTTLNECEVQVEKIFHPNNEKWIDSAEKMRQTKEQEIKAQATFYSMVVGAATGGFAVFSAGGGSATTLGAMIGAFLGSTLVQDVIAYLREDGEDVKFSNAENAQNFINGITEMANELSKTMYNAIEKQVSDACNQSCKNFYSQISKRMMEILQCANDRLNSTFNVNQIIPKKIDLKLKEIHLEVDDIGRIEKYRPASLFGLVPINLKENDSTWILSRSKLQQKCVASVKANLQRIQTDIVENTTNEMKQNFTSLFTDLQAYLIKYKGYAEICVSDKKLTEENQAKFKSELQELKEYLTNKAQEVDRFTEFIDWEKLV